MERAMGIEPTSEAWEASILPLYDARSGLILLQLGRNRRWFEISIIPTTRASELFCSSFRHTGRMRAGV